MKFSLYRGNLHKVPDIPRRWPLFRPSMSLQVFKKALAKRQEALNSLEQNIECSSDVRPRTEPVSTTGIVVTSGWKDDQEGSEGPASLTNGHNISDDGGSVKDRLETEDGGVSKARECGKRKREACELLDMEIDGAAEDDSFRVSESERDVGLPKDMVIDGDENCDRMDCDPEVNPTVKTTTVPEFVEKPQDLQQVAHGKSKCQIDYEGGVKGSTHIAGGMTAEEAIKEKEVEKLEAPRTPAAMDEECMKRAEREPASRLDACASPSFPSPRVVPLDAHKAERKAELEEKLKQLQETKHQLVQMLKQVLTSEEESKRRGQGLVQFPGSYVATGITDRSLEHKTISDLEEAMKDIEEEYSCLH